MPILVQLIIGIALMGFLVWLFNVLVPLDGKYKTAINGLIGLVLFLWILYCLSGFFGWGWFTGNDWPAAIPPHARHH